MCHIFSDLSVCCSMCTRYSLGIPILDKQPAPVQCLGCMSGWWEPLSSWCPGAVAVSDRHMPLPKYEVALCRPAGYVGTIRYILEYGVSAQFGIQENTGCPVRCLTKVSSTDARVWTEFAFSAASSGLCSPWDRRRLPSAVWQKENHQHYIASRAPDKAGYMHLLVHESYSEIALGFHTVKFSRTCNFIWPSPMKIAVWTIHGQNLLAWSRMQCTLGLAFGACHHAPHFPFGSSSHSKSVSPRVLFSFKAHRSNGEISRPGLTASDSREWGSWCVLFFETS